MRWYGALTSQVFIHKMKGGFTSQVLTGLRLQITAACLPDSDIRGFTGFWDIPSALPDLHIRGFYSGFETSQGSAFNDIYRFKPCVWRKFLSPWRHSVVCTTTAIVWPDSLESKLRDVSVFFMATRLRQPVASRTSQVGQTSVYLDSVDNGQSQLYHSALRLNR